MKEAVESVNGGKLNIKEASEKYQIPRSTLHFKAKEARLATENTETGMLDIFLALNLN